MMMRAVFSIALLALPVTLVPASEPVASQPLLDLAALIRTHGFINPSFVQPADEPVVGEAAAPAAEVSIVEPAVDAEAAADAVAAEPVAVAAADEPAAAGESAADAGAGAAVADGDCCGPVVRHYYVKPQRKVLQGGLIDEVIELERRQRSWVKRTLLSR